MSFSWTPVITSLIASPRNSRAQQEPCSQRAGLVKGKGQEHCHVYLSLRLVWGEAHATVHTNILPPTHKKQNLVYNS
jgi:hypothetical protein